MGPIKFMVYWRLYNIDADIVILQSQVTGWLEQLLLSTYELEYHPTKI